MTTQTSFVHFLNTRSPNDEKILFALRFYVAEVTDDELPDQMREEMDAAAGDGTRVQQQFDRLSKDRAAQVSAALAYFSQQWEDPEERQRIERAFDAAGTKLPVVEVGLIAIVAMYSMFLVATRGRKKAIRKVTKKPDGTYEESIEEEMWEPTGPLQAVVSLFVPQSKQGETGSR